LDKAALHTLIRSFLAEDIGRGDLTSESIFGPDEMGRARIVAREPFVVAGCEAVAAEVFWVQNPTIVVTDLVADGTRVEAGDLLFTVAGPVVDLLKAERLALNLLQRLSGIATLTARFVEQVQSCPVRITDTRKTTPGLRLLEKYAVQVGGGYNHRFSLADGILVKDNHIEACGSIARAVTLLRRKIPHTLRIEVEAETLEQVRECLACGVDIIMLDNMDPAAMQEAVRLIDHRALVEASGGVTLESVAAVAGSGVDIVSIGALTHSVRSCDIGMDWIA
jgi:nicotinate-nucleotide pyrophosphorylase (carboxylating)